MAFALVRPRVMTMSELRRSLPAANLAHMMITGALMGVLPRYNSKGEEDGPADPLSAAQRIEIADKLLKKVLPDLKTDEPVETRTIDASTLPTDPEQLRRFTTDQIRAAIEADFTSQYQEASAQPLAPETPSAPLPGAPHGAVFIEPPSAHNSEPDVAGTADSSPQPTRKKRARAIPPPQSG
jgi:hypothetical protein